jgi:hypothetical protein
MGILKRLDEKELYPYNIDDYGRKINTKNKFSKKVVEKNIESHINLDSYFNNINYIVNNRIKEFQRANLYNDIKRILPPTYEIGDISSFISGFNNDQYLEPSIKIKISQLLRNYDDEKTVSTIVRNQKIFDDEKSLEKLSGIDYLKDSEIENIVKKLNVDKNKKREIKTELQQIQRKLSNCRTLGNELYDNYVKDDVLSNAIKTNEEYILRTRKQIEQSELKIKGLVTDQIKLTQDVPSNVTTFLNNSCPLDILDDKSNAKKEVKAIKEAFDKKKSK